MDKMVYVMASGARQIMQSMAMNSHNLANANTVAFRQDLFQMRSQPVFGPGHPTRVYAMAERNAIDMQQGPMMSTNRELDFAINGKGWIAVQAADGSEAYTRAGDLRISSQGILENGAGYKVLGNSGAIAIPPVEKLDIGGDGTISVKPLGQSAKNMAVLDRVKLVNPDDDQLYKGSDGLMRMKAGGSADIDADVKLTSGLLEGSNVNPINALVNMIELQRNFDMQMKVMKEGKQNAAKSAALLKG